MRAAPWILGALLTAAVTGCHRDAPHPSLDRADRKAFHLRGKVIATDPAKGQVTVDHQAIPGLMDAMTMPYKLEQPDTLDELHPGDIITARVLVDQTADGPSNARLDNLVVVAQAKPDYKQAVTYHVPQPGETIPDFHLRNQSGRQIDLAYFRGRAVLLTFIYTRCPLADFCPRMSRNFAEIDKALSADKTLYAKTHLISVSFDPKYDTPKVLASYGGAHTGRFTEEDFAHWEFAAPLLPDLPSLEQYFDVGVTGDSIDPTSIQHSLSTVLIGKDGKVIAWYPTNDWKVTEVLERLKQAAAA